MFVREHAGVKRTQKRQEAQLRVEAAHGNKSTQRLEKERRRQNRHTRRFLVKKARDTCSTKAEVVLLFACQYVGRSLEMYLK